MQSFLQRHAQAVLGVLSGFDRLRFRGTVSWWSSADGMSKFLSTYKVLLKDFHTWAEKATDRLVAGVQQVAGRWDQKVQYVASPHVSKEELVDKWTAGQKPHNGLLAVLSAVEPCRSFNVYRCREAKQLELRYLNRKCLHYYLYFQDEMFGRMHVRLQSWFPFHVHICMNGREWLSRQMDAARLSYLRRDNCFVKVSDFAAVQRLLDRQPRIDWEKHLDRLLTLANPALGELAPGFTPRYYWTADQTEWATDVAFKSPADLAAIYPQLLRHGMTTFGSQEVLRFLGRKVPAEPGRYGRFAGTVDSDLTARVEGLRIKHHVNKNSLKMYDKQGSVLRVETTINNAKDLKTFRPHLPRRTRAERQALAKLNRRSKTSEPKPKLKWQKLRKGVADMRRRAELSQAANRRYLEALGAADTSQTLQTLVAKLCRPADWKGRRVRALNPLATGDVQLLATVARGEFQITGFRNRDLRAALYGPAPKAAAERRRQAARVSRQLLLLRGHGLIRKVPHSHRYVVSKTGLPAIAAILAANAASAAKLTSAA